MTQQEAMRLGRVQQAVIATLWTKEMYGAEIQKNLRLKGFDIGPGRLYPTLHRLLEIGALSCREDGRKYYKTTKKGKELIFVIFTTFFSLFSDLIEERVGFITDHIAELVQIADGMVVIDFSGFIYESITVKLAQLTTPTGRYFIMPNEKSFLDVLPIRIEHYQLEDVVTILEKTDEKIPLRDQSVDLALIFLSALEEEISWLIKELPRILKPTGRAIVVGTQQLKEEDILQEIMKDIFGMNPRREIDLPYFEGILNENNMEIEKQKIYKGILYLVIASREREAFKRS
ncbi:MAG: helix-turn-helix transcriptional regulator [Candidatus Hodarchaeota archaeon]